MKFRDYIFWGIILLIAIFAVAFNTLIYNVYVRQNIELNSIKEKLDVEAEFNSNKFKFEQEQVERLNKDLEDARQQINVQKNALADQNDALLQEVEKRQQVENDNKGIQSSLISAKAEADAIKQDIKDWQKDSVSVLAQLEKRMDDFQVEIKRLSNDVESFERNNRPTDASLPLTPPATDNKSNSPSAAPTQ